jgi:hypothetical protein
MCLWTKYSISDYLRCYIKITAIYFEIKFGKWLFSDEDFKLFLLLHRKKAACVVQAFKEPERKEQKWAAVLICGAYITRSLKCFVNHV